MIRVVLTVLASILFFVNFVELLKKINDGKDTSGNTFVGVFFNWIYYI